MVCTKDISIMQAFKLEKLLPIFISMNYCELMINKNV